MAEEAKCLSCHEVLPEGVCMACSECGFSYHMDKCSGVTKSALKHDRRNMRVVAVSNLHHCKSKGQTSSRDPGEKTENQLTEITRKLDVLMSIGAKVGTLLSMKETVDKIERSVKHMLDQYDEILEEMKKQNQDIKELRERVGRLENSGTQRVVEALKQEVNELQQYSRRQNLEVHGFPCLPNENLWHKLKEVSDQLGVAELTENDVEALYRMPRKSDKAPLILVRFTSRLTKDRWFQARAALKDNASGIWLMDNLTAPAKMIALAGKYEGSGKTLSVCSAEGRKDFCQEATRRSPYWN